MFQQPEIENGLFPSTLPALAVTDVHVSFGGIKALKGVCLNLAPGEVLGLIGPNGSGKTTLFDVISGLRSPQNGSVFLNGEDITNHSPTVRSRAGLRRTFQAVQVFGWLSVLDNVVSALDWEGGGGGFMADLVALPSRRRRECLRREVALQALDRFGLAGMADRSAASLPIGVARLVELARATVAEPSVLLLDEPVSGLDSVEAGRLAQYIGTIAQHHQCAVLLVEHDMEFLMAQCDRVAVLNLGDIIADGKAEDVRSNAEVRAAYLG